MTEPDQESYEKVRDTAIAMITSVVIADQIEDQDERIQDITQNMQMAIRDDLTVAEFYSVPGLMAQICSSLVTLTSELISEINEENDSDPLALWQKVAQEVRAAGLVE